MITLAEKQRLIREHLEVQRILNGLPVKRECASCEHWTGRVCGKYQAAPPGEVQQEGCEEWQEADYIPF